MIQSFIATEVKGFFQNVFSEFYGVLTKMFVELSPPAQFTSVGSTTGLQAAIQGLNF